MREGIIVYQEGKWWTREVIWGNARLISPGHENRRLAWLDGQECLADLRYAENHNGQAPPPR